MEVICEEPGLLKGKIIELAYHKGLVDNLDVDELLNSC